MSFPSLSLYQGLPITGFRLKESGWWGPGCKLSLTTVVTGSCFVVCNITNFLGYEPLDKFMAGYGFAFPAYYINSVALMIIMRLADSINISARMQILLDRPISWILTASLCTPFMGSKAFIALMPIITITALTSIYDFSTFDPIQNNFRSLSSLLSIAGSHASTQPKN